MMKFGFIITVVVVLLFAGILAPASADAADDNAAQFLARTDVLTREQIRNAETAAENEFGIDTAFRWDAFVNPNLKIYCWADDEYKSPDRETAKTVVGWFYKYSEAASVNNHGVRVSPLLVYIIGMGEGLINRMRDATCYPDIYKYNAKVSGFFLLGLDHFSDEALVLKSGGFLRQDFNEGDEYTPSSSVLNECGQSVRPARFANLEYGIEALAARVAYSKYKFESDARGFGVNTDALSEDQSNFWTYYYFNRGEGGGKTTLQSRVVNGALDDSGFIKAPGQMVKNGSNARKNSIIRTSTANFIGRLGLFA